MFGFKDKVVAVTGSTKGIGRRIAERFYAEGARVAVCGRSYAPAMLAEIASTGPGGEVSRLFGKAVDVRRVPELQAFVTDAIAAFGRIDVLVNDSGIYQPMPHFEVTEEIWDNAMSVNVKSYFFAAQAFARHVRERGGGGAIVNIASTNSLSVTRNNAVYTTSKAAVAMLTRSLALDWSDLGIRVNAVAPGSTPTDINAAIYADDNKLKGLQERIPMHRQGTRDEMANAVLFLASDLSSYTTGQILFVDGGWLLQ